MCELIQWPSAKYWEKTYNPVIGCRAISPGCQNCWAKAQAARFYGKERAEALWSGEHIYCKKKPPKSGIVFVEDMGDLFEDCHSDEQIREWVENLSWGSISLILTKRADRLGKLEPHLIHGNTIFYGVTMENQEEFNERWKHFRGISNNKWLSLEPLLSAIDISPTLSNSEVIGKQYRVTWGSFNGILCSCAYPVEWVVVGGESVGSRPGRECKLEWVESIVEQCRAADVPVFVKQIHLNGKLVRDIEKFPEHLRVRQVPWAERHGR